MKKQNVIRKKSLFHFGFGVDTMKNSVVCPVCSSLETGGRNTCGKCKARLPKTNLYELYKSYHPCCEKCGTVLSASMHYCPHCGMRVVNAAEICAL